MRCDEHPHAAVRSRPSAALLILVCCKETQAGEKSRLVASGALCGELHPHPYATSSLCPTQSSVPHSIRISMAANRWSIEDIIIDFYREHTGPQRSALLFDLGSKIARCKYRVADQGIVMDH
jgi:hypothetical protein